MGLVIGDCGTVGGLDETGAIEIGYGLAAEYRGRGYGTEAVVALSEWLLAQTDVEAVTAREVLADNLALVASSRTRGSFSRTSATV